MPRAESRTRRVTPAPELLLLLSVPAMALVAARGGTPSGPAFLALLFAAALAGPLAYLAASLPAEAARGRAFRDSGAEGLLAGLEEGDLLPEEAAASLVALGNRDGVLQGYRHYDGLLFALADRSRSAAFRDAWGQASRYRTAVRDADPEGAFADLRGIWGGVLDRHLVTFRRTGGTL